MRGGRELLGGEGGGGRGFRVALVGGVFVLAVVVVAAVESMWS